MSSAPTIYQSVMVQILQGMDNVACFLDDILVTAENDDQHLQRLEQVLARLDKCGIRASLTKCSLMQKSVDYLGHRLDSEGIHCVHPTSEKLQAITDARRP